MTVEAVVSTGMFAAVLWSISFLLPRAIATRDRLALVCAVLTAALAFVAWWLFAAGVRS